MKRSAFGGGIKAGGPNYVSCFVEFTENPVLDAGHVTRLSELLSDEQDVDRVNAAFANYQKIWEEEFSLEKDVSHVYGEENLFRYLPVKTMGFRVREADSLPDIFLVMIAANTTKTNLTVSISEKNPNREIIRKIAGIKLVVQDESDFIEDMEKYERIRITSPEVSDAFYQKAAKLGKYIADRKPLVEGRIELLHYLREQSIACEYHRYGSIFGERK